MNYSGYNEYYEKFSVFKEESMRFFQNIEKYKSELQTLMIDNFELIGVSFFANFISFSITRLQICNLSDVSLQPIRILCQGAHDEFSFSYIFLPQFIGPKKFLAIKHHPKVSVACACGNVTTAIHFTR